MRPLARPCLTAACCLGIWVAASGQDGAPPPVTFEAALPSTAPAAETIEPASASPLPAGVSELDVELYATYAYTWRQPEGDPTIECTGEFELRMGGYTVRSNDAVIWLKRVPWRDRVYYELEVFLWRNAEIRHPGGTVESGDALLASLRSFGRMVLNADGHVEQDDSSSDLYHSAAQVRSGVGLLETPPPESATEPVASTDLLRVRRVMRPPSRKTVSYRSDELKSVVRDQQRLVVATGNVYASQGSANSGDYLELRADAAVLFLSEEKLSGAAAGVAGAEGNSGGAGGAPETPAPAAAPAESPTGEIEPPPEISGGAPASAKTATPHPRGRGDAPSEGELPSTPEEEILRDRPPAANLAREYVEAIYLEGDVVLTRGSRMIRAERMYYDVQADRALILDAVMRAFALGRALPIYVRAEQVRQLSATEYTAQNARISNSEFHTPHASLGAQELRLTDRTPRNERGDATGVVAGTYDARHTTVALDGTPILYWPRSRGDFQEEQQGFRGIRSGYTDEFGGIVETRWGLFNVLGLEPPVGYDATLNLDYFTQRGPATGINLDYERPEYRGLVRTYYLHDDGEDDLGGNPPRGGPPDTENRGRATIRHRQFFEKGWELTLEASYISDDQFMENWERNEFENGKEQETLLYLLKRERNWQFSTLANFNINDFITETEHMPDLRLSLIGEPLGEYATFYHDSRTGVVRRDVSDDVQEWDTPPSQRSTGGVWRGDTREEFSLNLPALGPVKFSPYGVIRGSAWDDNPIDSGGVGRVFGSYGLRANMYLQRVYEDVESRLLDLHRLRHIIKPELTIWNAHDDRNSTQISQFDPDVEGIDDFGGGVLGVRQRWQTQRGAPGRWRTVDWIVLDIESSLINNPRNRDNTHGNFISPRPEDSISSNFLSVDFLYRVSDTTAIVYDGVYDWNRGNAGVSNVSLAFERLPRVSGFFGWRYIHDTNNNLIALGANYKLNEKHTIGVRELYDIDISRNAETQLILIRRWPRWNSAISLEWDRTIDDFGVVFSIWPEGAPNFAIGSKRFTGLGQSVGIRP